MSRIKKFDACVSAVIMLGFLTFGFLYPDIFEETLSELLWYGEGMDIFVFGLFGTLGFTFAGVAASFLIKSLIQNKPKKSLTSTNIVDFFGLGAAYMALRVISAIEGYGLIGKAYIEEKGLDVLKPVSIIFLIAAVIDLVIKICKICFIINEKVEDNICITEEDLNKTLLDTRGRRLASEDAIYIRRDESDFDKFAESEYWDTESETNSEITAEYDEDPKPRLKSTFKTSPKLSDDKSERNKRDDDDGDSGLFTVAGDL